MNENQVQENTAAEDMPVNFFGDDDITATEAAETNEVTESEEEEESTPAETSQEETPEQDVEGEQNDEAASTPFLTITYNKEKKDLTQDEAITYAQKGMNYDKLHSQYESVKEKETLLNEISRLAELNGMSLEDYVVNLNEVQNEFAISQEVEALKQKYPSADDGILRELAETHIKERNESRAKIAEDSAREKDEARKEEIGRQLDKFSQRYPDVDPQNLDSKIYSLMSQGYTLLEAYESVEADKRQTAEAKRQAEEKIIRQNEENKKKSLGNLSNSGDVEKDDFLKAFWSKD